MLGVFFAVLGVFFAVLDVFAVLGAFFAALGAFAAVLGAFFAVLVAFFGALDVFFTALDVFVVVERARGAFASGAAFDASSGRSAPSSTEAVTVLRYQWRGTFSGSGVIIVVGTQRPRST